MSRVKLYGIPSCGTVKKAKKWLEENQVEYDFVDFRKEKPSKDQIASWVKSFGTKPMRNTSGKAYRELGDARNTFDEAQWIEAFTNEPMLLKRPILEVGGSPSQVGFKDPEAWKAALS